MDAELEALVKQWLLYDFDPHTRRQVQQWVRDGATDVLRAAMTPRIAFGTAGLRAEMKAGYAHMNLLTVAQASQGLCAYVQQCFADAAQRGVVVGYDGRWNSLEYARRTAATFVSRGIKVYLFSEMVPTPFVSFGVVHTGACAGIMVTASHNPAPDNGYKVYWANGSQIVSPHDRNIAQLIEANLEPWPMDVAALTDRLRVADTLLADPTASVSAAYYARIASELCYHREANERSTVPITFTPMHGVGAKWVNTAFSHFGLPPYHAVMKQLFPDPAFPTVAFPNPEEGEGALRLAFEAADRVHSRLVLACDPDADRLAAAEKTPAHEWKPFSGNEIGTLLADWLLGQYRARHPHTPVASLLLVNTTVSSKMMQAIARHHGCRYEETLTGFKWMGDLVVRLERDEGCHLVLAYEQAIGYMPGNMSPDKDGVRTAAVFAEMAVHVYTQLHTTLWAHLDTLYTKYGYMAARDSYFFCYDPRVMQNIFDAMRVGGKYPAAVGEFAVTRVRDLQKPGHDSAQPDGKPTLPVSGSPMVTFFFANGGVITLRGSGTEPKLKYYSELPAGPGMDRTHADQTLARMIDAMVRELLKPEQNGLSKGT